MLILDLFSLLFCVLFIAVKTRLKSNITPYEENFYYLTHRYKI